MVERSPGLVETTVAVVGAGMAGLVAARELTRRGVDVLVLEANDRPGGRMLAETSVLGSRLDLGGQWLGHGHRRFAALAAELDAPTFRMRTPRRPGLVDGAGVVGLAHPATLTALAVVARWALAARTGAPDRWERRTLADAIARVPGRRAQRILEVVAGVASTADLDRFTPHALASTARVQGGLVAMLTTRGGAQDSLLVDGAGVLVERIAADLGPRLRTGCAVTAIERDADGVTLRTTAGDVRAAKVVVTVPPPTAARIAHDPPLPAWRRAAEEASYLGSVYKAIAVYERPFWRDADREAEALLLGEPGGACFDTSPPDGPGHLCFLVAGADARALDGLDPAGRRTALLGQLAPHLGAAVLEPAGWHEKAWHLDEHVGGGYVALPLPGSQAGYLPLPSTPDGHLHWAGTETASDHPGYIEGAIESGERVAGEVAAALRG
ncbi:flavin monoamine oxidase family protein [Pimelobacter simplex]|uniref:flavin monoamine oxidase family protein n=1 Tax=Nocardioides simplex TaxID=2045 RepID=UPI00380E7784